MDQEKKKTLGLKASKLQKFEINSGPFKIHIPDYKANYIPKEALQTNNLDDKRKFIFKKTFSRFICVQLFYNIRFKINISKKDKALFTDIIIRRILNQIIEIDESEWNIFSYKKIMMNFILSNINFYINNFEKLESVLDQYLPKGNLSKNQMNDSIFLSALSEFFIFINKLSSQEECLDLEAFELQANNQKKIIINEYIDVLIEFSDDFFIKYINGAFEVLFSEMIRDHISRRNVCDLDLNPMEEKIDQNVCDLSANFIEEKINHDVLC
jgi:transcription termination factor NusB